MKGDSESLRPAIRAANLNSAAKEIADAVERATGAECSVRVGQRIVATGKAPGWARRHVIAFLKTALRRNAQSIADIERRLEELEREEMAAASAGGPRMASAAGPAMAAAGGGKAA